MVRLKDKNLKYKELEENLFQFLMVRLKVRRGEFNGFSVEISIPYGAIKRHCESI